MTKNAIVNRLEEFSNPRTQDLNFSLIEEHRLFFQKEKYLYHTMNLMTLENNIFFGYCWCPNDKAEKVAKELTSSASKGFTTSQLHKLPTDSSFTPPTSFNLNDFTKPFQDIVDTYGIPRYREVNPGLFTVVTFPFLFAIMFGDLGHGSILFLLALYVTCNATKLAKSDSFLRDLVPVRYLLLLMGFFAAYCGLLYNDFMSLPLNLFGSCYDIENGEALKKENCVYTVGVDPAWIIASNELSTMNSLKMKLSVIFGVVQMTFGVLMKGVNNIYYKQYIDFIHEFLPQLLFMICTFGWMDAMIFIKWLTPWEHTYQAPSIINLFLNMVLGLGSTKGTPLWSDVDQQEKIQFILLIISVVCVPWMFLVKPWLLIGKHKTATAADTKHKSISASDMRKPLLTSEIEMAYEDVQSQENQGLKSPSTSASKENHESSEIWVHQLIETIEFVLGSISNTASYLRLWALSLAHSQLSKVFFEKGVKSGLESGNVFVLIVGVFIFLNITFAVLMCMDLMECFLHALRLHWVEFQNKFYKADGYKFEPFSFESALKG